MAIVVCSSTLPGCIANQDSADSVEEFPLASLLDIHRTLWNHDLETDDIQSFAINITTWQMDHGGWGKNSFDSYNYPWDGQQHISPYFNGGNYLGTFDNNATTSEIRLLAEAFHSSRDIEFRTLISESIQLGIDFILESQFPSGAWPQVYPERVINGGNYSNFATFNDHVMTRVMILIWDIIEGRQPFSGEITQGLDMGGLNSSLNKGIDFILKSQIVVDGKPTIWCQQHHPYSLVPMHGRPYELPSKASLESTGIVSILLNWPYRDSEVVNSTWGAVDWFIENSVPDRRYEKKTGNFSESPGSLMWFRFHNLSDEQYFMSGRDSVKVYNIGELTDEMRTGYWWAGDWGMPIIIATSNIDISERF